MKNTGADFSKNASVSIALNYLNWDTTTKSADDLVLEDFIAEVVVSGMEHKENGKHIWVNILFEKPEESVKPWVPVFLEVTASKSLKNEVVIRKDSHKLSKKELAQFLEDTHKFFGLFGLDFTRSAKSTLDRVIIYNKDERILHFDDAKGMQKTTALHADERREQIEFILSYLGLTNRFNFFTSMRKMFGRFLKV